MHYISVLPFTIIFELFSFNDVKNGHYFNKTRQIRVIVWIPTAGENLLPRPGNKLLPCRPPSNHEDDVDHCPLADNDDGIDGVAGAADDDDILSWFVDVIVLSSSSSSSSSPVVGFVPSCNFSWYRNADTSFEDIKIR